MMAIATLLLFAPGLFVTAFAKLIVTDTATPVTCEGKDAGLTFSYSSSSGSYDILCGTDYWGGDLVAQTTDTFEKCLEACDSATDVFRSHISVRTATLNIP